MIDIQIHMFSMHRSRRLWAVFLTLTVAFFLMERGVSNVSVGQVATTEEPFPTSAIVIDDTDAERFATEGDGWAKNGFPVGYRGSVWMHKGSPQASQPRAAAHWTFRALPAGTYDVYATWVWGKTLPTSIAYTVTGDGQPLLSAAVDQQKTPVGPRWTGSMYPWQKLGTVTLEQDEANLQVSIDAASTETFSADAAMLLPRANDTVPVMAVTPPAPPPTPSADAPDAATITEEAVGYVCNQGYCTAVLGTGTPLQECQATCTPEPRSSAISSAPSFISSPISSSVSSSETIPSSASVPTPVITPATLEPATSRWVTVGPPHASFTSCALQCAARGGTCMENACAPFQTIWDGQTWAGGQKLIANETLLFHNTCYETGTILAPTLQNDCCCMGIATDPFCGDGIVSAALGEECDDGNRKPGDGCSPNCKREFCGDGIVSAALGEECDPAIPVTFAGARCSAQCRWEYCGDGIVQTDLGEQCDTGNRVGEDECTPGCRLP